MSNKDEIEKALDHILDNYADAIFSLSQLNIVKNQSVDEGTLLKSGNVNRKFLEKEIVYAAPHAIWVEYGTDPHNVSVAGREKIKFWAMRKLGLNEKEATSAAFAISKNIQLTGTDPKPFLRPALDEVMLRGVHA